MNEQVINAMFALIRKVVCGADTSAKIKEIVTPEILPQLYVRSKAHDMAHIVAQGLSDLGLLGEDEISQKFQKQQMLAVYRYQKINYELQQICSTLETAEIPFLPLKGSVIRQYYPEPWIRTSCDIDVLVHEGNLDCAIQELTTVLQYKKEEVGSHDVSLFSASGVHIELHYDLVEDGLANESSNVLKTVWDMATVRSGYQYWNEMSDELFYFYHIAHMAKHFENGGCGIRPFIDLYVLDNLPGVDVEKRNELLAKGKLIRFANVSRKLSRVWFANDDYNLTSKQMEDYILRGGVYGNNENRITVQQQKKGGRMKYALSKIFIPYDVIKFHYPILQKHKWLTPVMEVRRWCKLIFCGHLKRTTQELRYNNNISNNDASNMQAFLEDVGLN